MGNLDILNKHNFKFNKAYGQNFIFDKNFLKSFVTDIVDKDTNELTEIKLLNKHDNSVIKRKKVKLSGGDK